MSDVIEANVHVHTKLADHYDSDEPHFRPENKAKVSKRLEALRQQTGPNLLDLGCGTGFIIDLARPYFRQIRGVDVTPAMLAKVNTAGHDVEVFEGRVEALPFEDNSFDACSAYSFLDHLEHPGQMLKEAFRVLKPGGKFYIDLVPNQFYWQAVGDAAFHDQLSVTDFVAREHHMVTSNDKTVEEQYGIDAAVFRKAEPAKELAGVDPFAFRQLVEACGFAKCEIHFDWFLGNAKVLHQQGSDDAEIVMKYLQECLPVSRHMFKYVWFVLEKGDTA